MKNRQIYKEAKAVFEDASKSMVEREAAQKIMQRIMDKWIDKEFANIVFDLPPQHSEV
jgi:hypothetical protein